MMFFEKMIKNQTDQQPEFNQKVEEKAQRQVELQREQGKQLRDQILDLFRAQPVYQLNAIILIKLQPEFREATLEALSGVMKLIPDTNKGRHQKLDALFPFIGSNNGLITLVLFIADYCIKFQR